MKTIKTVWIGLALMVLLGAAPSWSTASSSLPGQNYVLTPEMLRFRYLPFDDGEVLQCSHVLESAPAQDWRVKCSNAAQTFSKEYLVHLWVTRYSRSSAQPGGPKVSYEVLYWIRDLSEPGQSKGTGTTVWFHLKQEAELHSLELGQSVDEDTAELNLAIAL